MRFERIIARFAAQVGPIRLEVPALYVIPEGRYHDLVQDLSVNGRILDRNQEFDPAIEVAGHPVGGREVDLRLG